MFISKNTSLKEFDFVSQNENFEISKDIALNREYLDFLCTKFPNSKITILSGYDIIYTSTTTLYNKSETKILADNANYVLEKYGKTLTFDEDFSVKQAITASRKINNIVDEINSAKVNGQSLSPFEKFVLAYHFVTNRVYNEVEEGDDTSKSRRLISVLNSDKIVCVGFASLLATVLNRLDIPCTTQCIVSYDNNLKGYGNHATCLVRIDDPKYNMNGIYFSDPTGDSAKKRSIFYGENSFTSALIKYDTVKKFFVKPIMLDAAAVKEDMQTIQEVADNSLDVPPILANLFPEKTGGKPQNEIIRKTINEQLNQLNINSVMENLISNISQEQIEMLSSEIANRILNSSRLMYDYSNGQLDMFFNSVSNGLHYMGYSNKEILFLFDIFYNPENNKNIATTFYKNIHHYTEPFNDKQIKQIDAAAKAISRTVDRQKALLSQTNFKETKSLDDCYEDILDIFSSFAVSQMHNSNEQINDKYAGVIKYLISKGVSLHEIKLKLKSMLNSYDYSAAYFEQNDSLLNYIDINEQELYAGYFLPYVKIYNEPYNTDFEKLTKEARFVSKEDYTKACINYFLSQGLSKEDAVKHAEAMLQQTNIFNPDQLS